MFKSSGYCLEVDTYYLAEKSTIAITQGVRKLIPEELKKIVDGGAVSDMADYMPAIEFLRAHGDFKVLMVPAYTLHQIMLQSDALITAGYVVLEGACMYHRGVECP